MADDGSRLDIGDPSRTLRQSDSDECKLLGNRLLLGRNRLSIGAEETVDRTEAESRPAGQLCKDNETGPGLQLFLETGLLHRYLHETHGPALEGLSLDSGAYQIRAGFAIAMVETAWEVKRRRRAERRAC